MSKQMGEPWARTDHYGAITYYSPSSSARRVVPHNIADREAEAKRFTDGELAAEMYKAFAQSSNDIFHGLHADDADSCRAFSDRSEAETDRGAVFERFATQPHYDEERNHDENSRS